MTPEMHEDSRGHFATPFEAHVKEIAFPVAQVSHSTSHRGVVRGVHFTSTPPGCAKLVWCAAGRAVDFIVDLRVGSPTFGVVDRVDLDAATGVAVSLPVGVGHAYQALTDATVITYLLSTRYVADNEQALAVTDPDLALDLPLPDARVCSERDLVAPTLAQWLAQGGLPDYEAACRLDRELRDAAAERQAVENGRTSSAISAK